MSKFVHLSLTHRHAIPKFDVIPNKHNLWVRNVVAPLNLRLHIRLRLECGSGEHGGRLRLSKRIQGGGWQVTVQFLGQWKGLGVSEAIHV